MAATMAAFGIAHTINTRVGNDFIRGVSGGERKRVSIAEASLAGAPLQCEYLYFSLAKISVGLSNFRLGQLDPWS